jgi:hypothetical protein
MEPTTEEQKFEESVRSAWAKIMEQREDILKAFVAKYGLQPDKVEQVIIRRGNRIMWRVRRRI